jgi:ABC-2 type transport system ATP-binding protein
MIMTVAIETDGLVKRYGEVTAVDDLSLRVKRGEIYAFLGLNGAGKTTTIRMLLGMVKPTAGSAHVLGTGIRRGAALLEAWRSVGYMVERPYAYPELTVRENLDAVRRLRPGTPPGAVDRVIDQVGLAAYAGRRTSTLSQGNAQRLGLAKALLHEPKLLILDEPANGLDPAGIVEIRALLRKLVVEDGVTIFMSSHILAEVARLVSGMPGRIGIIHEGRLLQEVDAADLARQRRRWLHIDARDRRAAGAALAAAGYSPLTDSGQAPSAGSRGEGQNGFAACAGIVLLEERAINQPDDIAALLVNAGCAPTMLNIEHEDLEHYFLRLVGMGEASDQ